MKASNTRTALCLLPLLLPLAGCFFETTVAAGPPILDEGEPNDQPDQATWLGSIVPGTGLIIGGHVTDQGPDFFDGFALTAATPCTVRIALHALAPGADLDLCVYDPLFDDFVACFDWPFDPELGEISFFVPGEELQLVVSSAYGSSSYTLEIDAFPLYAAESEAPAPGAADKGTRARLAPYRRSGARPSGASPAAEGVVGAIDLRTGERIEAAFRTGPGELQSPR